MNDSTNISVEMPSGKDADYENFPVGSWLLAADLRPHIAVFYNFARAIDDVADSPDIPPEDKIDRLDGFEQALLYGGDTPGFEKAYRMRQSLAETNITPRHCQDLIAAFKMDATKLRYRDWDDLVAYCILSAAPVGRYLLDLHGGSRNGYAASDALCIALQVINHLQDCQEDYRLLDRVYLPLEWMMEEGASIENLGLSTASPAIRRVLDRMIEATENTLRDAATLPGGLNSRRLAMESAVILNIAWRLSSLLRRRDPLASRVKLSGCSLFGCGVRGVFSVIFQGQEISSVDAIAQVAAIAYVESVVRRSGTSFFWAMRRLPPGKRNAMYALYAFCREVDDIADEPGKQEEKLSRLEGWRKEIGETYEGRPECLVSKALLGPIRCFPLAEDNFQAIIDGMEMDAGKSLRIADMDELNLYCDRVACAVGRLSNCIFGIDLRQGNKIAAALGRALQLTNILRDLEEDAGRDRMYLPATLLRANGIASDDPVKVLDDPAMDRVFAELAGIAKSDFEAAAAELRLCDKRQMRPAIVMMEVYRRIFLKLLRRGWKRGYPPVSLSKIEKLWIVVRHGIF